MVSDLRHSFPIRLPECDSADRPEFLELSGVVKKPRDAESKAVDESAAELDAAFVVDAGVALPGLVDQGRVPLLLGRPRPALHANQLRPCLPPLLGEPVGVNEPHAVIIPVLKDGVPEALLLAPTVHRMALECSHLLNVSIYSGRGFDHGPTPTE